MAFPQNRGQPRQALYSRRANSSLRLCSGASRHASTGHNVVLLLAHLSIAQQGKAAREGNDVSFTTRGLRVGVAAAALAGTLTTTGIIFGPAATADYGTVAATTAVNVRLGPTTASDKIGLLEPGSTVTQRGATAGGWTPVVFNGREAWVAAQYLVSTQPLSHTAEPLGTATASATVNIRARGTIFSEILGRLAEGQPVSVLGESVNGWTPVDHAGKQAWISTQYLRLSDTPGPTSGQAEASTPAAAEPTTSPPGAGQPQPAAPSTQPTTAAPATTKPATAAPTTPPSAVVSQAVANTVVNVREQATTASPSRGLLAKGESIGVTGVSQNGWTPVNYGGQAGWVASRYLDTVAVTPPTTAPPTSTSAAYTTTAVNIRAGASTTNKVITVADKGTAIQLTGKVKGQWSEIVWDGSIAWICNLYISSDASASTPESTTTPTVTAPSLPKVIATKYTTTGVNVRTTSSPDSPIVDVAPAGTSVQVTGVVENGRTQVIWAQAVRWIASSYLASSPDSAPVAAALTGGSLNTGGSSGLDQIKASAKNIVLVTRQRYPQIKTMYGWRSSADDHGAGKAVDLMLPSYRSNQDLGWEIANYYRTHASELGIQYIIFGQKIWNISRDGEGWRAMADRGSDTQNHYDHVHITMK